MFKQVDSLGQIRGVTTYLCHDGVPEPFPIIVDQTAITLPQITHPTYSQQMMGDTDLPDQSRVNPMTTGVEADLSIIHSKMLGYGVKEYLFKWAQQIKKEDGSLAVVGFSAYVAGIPSEDVGATVRVGEDGRGTMNIATLKYRLVCEDKELRFVDRRSGTLKINGEDFRREIEALL